MTENAALDNRSPFIPPNMGEPEEHPVLGEDTPPNSMVSSCSISVMNLCEVCLNYDITMETLYQYQRGDSQGLSTTFGHLVRSAPTCILCELVLDGFERWFSIDRSARDQFKDDSVILLTVWTTEETTIGFFLECKPDSPEAPPSDLSESGQPQSNLRVYRRRRYNDDDAIHGQSPPLEDKPDDGEYFQYPDRTVPCLGMHPNRKHPSRACHTKTLPAPAFTTHALEPTLVAPAEEVA